MCRDLEIARNCLYKASFLSISFSSVSLSIVHEGELGISTRSDSVSAAIRLSGHNFEPNGVFSTPGGRLARCVLVLLRPPLSAFGIRRISFVTVGIAKSLPGLGSGRLCDSRPFRPGQLRSRGLWSLWQSLITRFRVVSFVPATVKINLVPCVSGVSAFAECTLPSLVWRR